MQKINKNSLDGLIHFLKDKLAFGNENYKITPVSSIVFSYGIRDGAITPAINTTENKNINYQIYYRNQLPLACKPEDYGTILSKISNTFTISVNQDKKAAIIILQVKKEDGKTVNYIKYFKNNNLLFSWTDTINSFKKNNFIRRIGKSILQYENGELALYTTIKKTSSILPKKASKKKSLDCKIITMDLETININNRLVPYLISYFDGIKTYSHFLEAPDNLEALANTEVDINKNEIDSDFLELLLEVMTNICRKKYKDYKIYMHNFAKFDGYFLVRHLSQFGYCDPRLHKGRIISCRFQLPETGVNVTFMDSYLMLTSSLKDLSKSFNVTDPKGAFPVLFNDIHYSGVVPNQKYFVNITDIDYNNYLSTFKDKI